MKKNLKKVVKFMKFVNKAYDLDFTTYKVEDNVCDRVFYTQLFYGNDGYLNLIMYFNKTNNKFQVQLNDGFFNNISTSFNSESCGEDKETYEILTIDNYKVLSNYFESVLNVGTDKIIERINDFTDNEVRRQFIQNKDTNNKWYIISSIFLFLCKYLENELDIEDFDFNSDLMLSRLVMFNKFNNGEVK